MTMTRHLSNTHNSQVTVIMALIVIEIEEVRRLSFILFPFIIELDGIWEFAWKWEVNVKRKTNRNAEFQ